MGTVHPTWPRSSIITVVCATLFSVLALGCGVATASTAKQQARPAAVATSEVRPVAEGASGQGDPTGARAAALQQAVATAAAQGGGTLALDGVYNFSVYGDSLEIVGGAVKLVGNGATLLFRGAGALPNGRTILPGVNFTNCVNAGLSGVAIDYVPKPIGLNCNFRTNSWLPPTPGCKQSGVGITLHFFNCTDMLVEDVTINAAPHMAITSFNGEGGHVLRRVKFETNAPGQIFVAERDGIHESDVRRGITVEDSAIQGLNDDFFNVHSTLLVVYTCDPAPTRRCTVINPHVEGGDLDTTYGTNSVLSSAIPSDPLTFLPFVGGAHPPDRLVPLGSTTLKAATRVTDHAVLAAALAFANATHNEHPGQAKQFAGDGRALDVWTVQFADPLPFDPPPPRSLVSVDHLVSAGAKLINNTFNFTTCSARWKSPGSVIASNKFALAGHNLEITYLQSWFEGAGLISNVLLQDNTFHYGAGVNPINPNPMDTSEIVQSGNRFLSPLHRDV